MMTNKLLELSNEVARIAGILAQLSNAELPCSKKITPQLIRSMLAARRLGVDYLGEGLFHDPAWDMLLELMLASLEGARLSVSALAGAGGIAPTTGLRWIEKLEERGFVSRSSDIGDGRRVFVVLTPDGEKRMRAYLSDVA